MQQIPLPLQLENTFVFDNFFETNSLVISTLQAALSNGALLKLVGSIGKTHLLQATCHFAKSHHKTIAYVPFKQFSKLPIDALDLEGKFDVLCLDDVELIVGKLLFEQKLFTLFNFAYDQKKTLILSSHQSKPAFSLPDFRSRWDMLSLVKIPKMTEAENRQALLLHARHLGFDLDDKVVDFIFNHLTRHLGYLVDFLKQLLAQSIIEKRRISIQFIKTFIDTHPKFIVN